MQVFFSSAVEELAVNSIDYPCPEPAHNISTGRAVGNLPILMRIAAGDEIFDHKQAKDFPTHFSPRVANGICQIVDATPFDIVLISGELFPLVPADQLSAFLTQLALRSYPELLCLVRDPFDFVLSMWKQQVRAQLYTQGFEAFVEDVLTGREQASMLTRFDAMAGLGVPMTVLRYERLREDIVGNTLRALNLAEPGLLAFDRPGLHINASESASRTALAIELLQETDDPDLTDVVMKTLSARNPAAPAPEPYDANLHSRILAHFRPTIERINAGLPPEHALATEIRGQEVRPPAVSEHDRCLARVILAELEQQQSGQYQDNHYPELPMGFDPAVYLLRNPDLLAAGVDPVSHFLTAGRNENRPWRLRREKPALSTEQSNVGSGDAG